MTCKNFKDFEPAGKVSERRLLARKTEMEGLFHNVNTRYNIMIMRGDFCQTHFLI